MMGQEQNMFEECEEMMEWVTGIEMRGKVAAFGKAKERGKEVKPYD